MEGAFSHENKGERTRETDKKALHRRREGRLAEAPFYWKRRRSPSSVTTWGYSQRCSTTGKKSSSRTEPPPSRPKGRADQQAEQERIAYLEKQVQRKDEVLAELMGEHIALKTNLGTLNRGLGRA